MIIVGENPFRGTDDLRIGPIRQREGKTMIRRTQLKTPMVPLLTRGQGTGQHKVKSALCLGLATLALLMPLSTLVAQDAGSLDAEKAKKLSGKKTYSPYANRKFPTRPLFGDTHLHTAMSLDAGVFGANLMPRDAYRFARGEQVTSNSGQPVKLSRPLDFLVVTDHSDNMGWVTDLKAGKPELLADKWGKNGMA